MGMYAAIYGKVNLKPFVEDIMGFKNGIPEDGVDWENLIGHSALRDHPDIINFLNVPRHDQIAVGQSAYFGCHYNEENWQEVRSLCQDKHAVYDSKDKSLIFYCSLKNYKCTIEAFVKILPIIATHWKLYEIYEEHKDEWEPDVNVSKEVQGGIFNEKIRGDRTGGDEAFGYGFWGG